MGKTLAEKLWDSHVVRSQAGEPDLLFIDMHLVHEVTSPQAFEGLRLAGRPVHRPDLTLATEDHNTPTDYTCRSSAPHPSRTRSAARRSTSCARTAPSSASGSTRWATPSRASCTSSARSSGSPSRA